MHDPRVVEAVGAEAARFLRDETVFGVTNYRYRASPAFDRVFLPPPIVTIQHFNESRQRS
jgi:hypothetical protein